tara:strand:- start:74389 stop:74709 length:321 start_codon:yes stop_codon:yes gene_type:complete
MALLLMYWFEKKINNTKGRIKKSFFLFGFLVNLEYTRKPMTQVRGITKRASIFERIKNTMDFLRNYTNIVLNHYRLIINELNVFCFVFDIYFTTGVMTYPHPRLYY